MAVSTSDLLELVSMLEARAALAQQTHDSLDDLPPAASLEGEMKRTWIKERNLGEVKAYIEAANLLRDLLKQG